MQFEVMNRLDARYATYEPIAPKTIIISLTDTGTEPNRFHWQPWLRDVLELQFLDVEEGELHCITREQAKIISKFARKHYKNVERIIVHCEFGQCRSAAVAAAICEYFEGHDNGIWRNPAYYPNRTCYRYVRDALKRRWFYSKK